MNKSIDVTGKTEEEAIASALKMLGKTRDEVSLEIVERSKSGFLGIGASPAKVRVSYEADEAEAAEAAKPTAPIVKKSPPAHAAGTREGEVEAFLSGLLGHMGISAEIEISSGENGRLNVALSGPGMGAVIGRRGETLDAIQHLTNYSINHGSEARTHVNVDAENYRSKREQSLMQLAEKMAAKAIKYRRSMALEPMNSYERHVIHAALQEFDGVSTASTGSEPNRRVVISCDRQQTAPKPQVREWL